MQLIQREADAMVGDSILFVVVGANLLAATTLANLGTTLGRHLCFVLFLLTLQQPRAQYLHRLDSILQLTALILHRNHHPCRLVGDAYR